MRVIQKMKILSVIKNTKCCKTHLISWWRQGNIIVPYWWEIDVLDIFKENTKVNKKKEAFMIVLNIAKSLKQNFFVFFEPSKRTGFTQCWYEDS